MKSSKDDEKSMEPMFPRLHVKDTTHLVGGPRAPPRNKMALYEQLTLPLPSRSTTAGVQSNSSAQQGCGNERQNFSPFHMPQVPAHLLDRGKSVASEGMNCNASSAERSIDPNSCRTPVGTRPVTDLSSAHQNEPGIRDSRGRKVDHVDDFRVPTFDQSGLSHSKKETRMMELPKLTSFSINNSHKRQFGMLNTTAQSINSSDKPSESSTSNFKSMNIDRSVGKNTNGSVVIREFNERSGIDKVGDRSTTNEVSLRKDLTWKSLRGDSIVSRNSQQDKELNCNNVPSDGLAVVNQQHSMEPSCTKRSPVKGCGTLDLDNNRIQNHGANIPSDGGQKDFVPEASVELVSGSEITPDNVVGRIGPKHFWKARRAIVNQQRVFSIQVFELHRLIEVQKLIAGSPHLLLEGNVKSSQKTPTNITVSESNANTQPETVRQNDNSHGKDKGHEIEVTTSIAPLPNCGERVNRELEGPIQNGSSASVPPAVAAADNKPNAWCFQPPSNQWLVPVMSPSEGLVYKPYASLCPPGGGLMAPIYGSCTPNSPAMVPGNFVNQVYGVSQSNRPQSVNVHPSGLQVMPNYYAAPFVIPAVNPHISNSAVEQVSYLDAPRTGGHTEQHSKSSCNMSNARSEAFSTYPSKLPESKDSEFQGSTASSPSEKVRMERKGTSASLFPKFQTQKKLASPEHSNDKNNQTLVIKVVPHNARSASESAARIFQSIQEERQKHS